ncbi:TlpA family protein disulfide reductase [Sphingobacterium nematocida]|nr:hypothetical protein [Sphingobacterium nematocida]
MLTQATKRITQDYGIKAFPTKVLIDNKGNIVAKFVGDDGITMESLFEKLMNKKGN